MKHLQGDKTRNFIHASFFQIQLHKLISGMNYVIKFNFSPFYIGVLYFPRVLKIEWDQNYAPKQYKS